MEMFFVCFDGDIVGIETAPCKNNQNHVAIGVHGCSSPFSAGAGARPFRLCKKVFGSPGGYPEKTVLGKSEKPPAEEMLNKMPQSL